jgi:hypothetical protein
MEAIRNNLGTEDVSARRHVLENLGFFLLDSNI